MNNRISQEPSITAELYKSVKLSYNTLFMENSVDSVTTHSNSPDREFGTRRNSIIQIFCNKEKSLLIKSQEVKL